jgi:hypothetical protein
MAGCPLSDRSAVIITVLVVALRSFIVRLRGWQSRIFEIISIHHSDDESPSSPRVDWLFLTKYAEH